MNSIMLLILGSVITGVSLAMDAFSVSVVYGLCNINIRRIQKVIIASTFGFCQFLFTFAGYFLGHLYIENHIEYAKYIPIVSFVLLLIVGGHMIISAILEGKRGDSFSVDDDKVAVSNGIIKPFKLMVEGCATALDALSVGVSLTLLNLEESLLESSIIGIVTLVICYIGISIGKKLGERFTSYAQVAGGIILILIGVKILVF
ncbi:MAG: manganese efflux pump MntP family protein [Eubacterium sp.]|nr:manganese efflux pump MntP family protein [Eubacterium sp.]